MFQPVKIIDLELSKPVKDIKELDGYYKLKAVIRLYGAPLGYVQMPIINGICKASELTKAILEDHSWAILKQLMFLKLHSPLKTKEINLDNFFNTKPLENKSFLPLVSVAICTRDRTDYLSQCLEAIKQLDYANLEILVIDNAPSSNSTKCLVESAFPGMRYVEEPRPGLNWARNRAIIESQGEIIAFTDDDVIVDHGWVSAIANVFISNPDALAVTGLVVPYELETKAQQLFEYYGGFGRGFDRKWIRVDKRDHRRWRIWGTGQFGTGANMAFRASIFEKIGYFDPALDVGTLTNGGGDLEMFFRVLKEGYLLVYEPQAMNRHRHRQEYTKLKKQLTYNGHGLYSYFLRSSHYYPDEKWAFLRLGIWWLLWWHIRRILGSFIKPQRFPRELILAEFFGVFPALFRYLKAQKTVQKLLNTYGPQEEKHSSQKDMKPARQPIDKNAIAIRSINLNHPKYDITDVKGYKYVRILVFWHEQLLGQMDIANYQQNIGSMRIRQAVAENFALNILEHNNQYQDIIVAMKKKFKLQKAEKESQPVQRLDGDIPVSIIVATYDRPEDLRECLKSIKKQNSSRSVELIVVDNNPASGLTPAVVEEFSDILLINEKRRGVSYARNAGITASSGKIIVITDDDVVVPENWLEKMIRAFRRSDIMIVTGNVLAMEQNTLSQRLYEKYGGLGKGMKSLEVDSDWFESFRFSAVPTWNLGAAANIACRASMFKNPQIGMFEETLGPGVPSGVGEDTYIFYKVLKAGYTIRYEASAYVWHKHRRTMSALYRQVYNYSKGHIAYHLTTFYCDRDLRGILHILVQIPKWRLKQIYYYFKDLINGNECFPFSMFFLEIIGNFVGPFAFWRSRRLIKKTGRSTPIFR